MPTLEDAIALALEAHRGQIDRLGQPYILHVLRVLGRVESDTLRFVAVLHDVVEKTGVTLEALRQYGYDEAIVGAVDALTRRDGERYADHVQRIRQNPLAVPVKRADLQDHLDVQHWPLLTPGNLERVQNYQNAWLELARYPLTNAEG